MRYLLLLCLLLSCTTPRQSEVSGDVYIITRGRDTVKLSSSPVYFFDYFDTQNHLARNAGAEKLEIVKGMPKLLFQTQTDTNGHFQIKVPPGKYFVNVIEQRAVFDKTEVYYWLVPVDATQDAKIILDNSNLSPD